MDKFLEILYSMILGAIQGFTEFLPVSSSGHLVIAQKILGMDENAFFMNVMLHMGTLVAVCIYYFRDILHLFTRDGCKTLWFLVLATIPAGLVRIFLDEPVNMLFEEGKYVCFGFLITAAVLFVTEWLGRRRASDRPITWKSALIMGVAQGVAVVPGISRSGSTIAAGVLTGTNRTDVAKFSFLMSIPVIAGSALLELLHVDFAAINWLPCIAGMITSGICGYLAISFMVKLIGRCNFKWFSLYLLILSILTFTNSFLSPFLY